MTEVPEASAPLPDPPAPEGYWGAVWRRYRRHKTGMCGFVLFVLLAGAAFFAPVIASGQPVVCKYKESIYFPAVVDTFHNIPGANWIYAKPKPFRFPQFNAKKEIDPKRGDWAVWAPIPWDPAEVDLVNKLLPPSKHHVMGTDELGRDVAARMIHATGIAMLVGFIAMGIATVIGLILGSVAGYLGGWWDIVISRLLEVFICIPPFYVILIILTILPPSIYNVMIVLGVFRWTSIARYVRGEFMKLKNLDYALAARALGASDGRIIFRHVLPNALAPVLVVVAFGVATAIFVETGLSWLGFGVMPPTPTWGNILRTGYDNLRVAPHLIFPPSIAVFVTVLTMNLIGDALRDVTDPRLVSSA